MKHLTKWGILQGCKQADKSADKVQARKRVRQDQVCQMLVACVASLSGG